MILTLQRPVLWYVFIVTVFLFFSLTTHAGFGQAVPVLKLVNGTVTRDGHMKIEWKLREKGVKVELQQAENENFAAAKTIYRGPDQATFISGLENGTYYYRIRRAGGAWSDPVALTVQHHSLQLAFVLFSLGAIVFALTVFIVVKGALQTPTD